MSSFEDIYYLLIVFQNCEQPFPDSRSERFRPDDIGRTAILQSPVIEGIHIDAEADRQGFIIDIEKFIVHPVPVDKITDGFLPDLENDHF